MSDSTNNEGRLMARLALGLFCVGLLGPLFSLQQALYALGPRTLGFGGRWVGGLLVPSVLSLSSCKDITWIAGPLAVLVEAFALALGMLGWRHASGRIAAAGAVVAEILLGLLLEHSAL